MGLAHAWCSLAALLRQHRGKNALCLAVDRVTLARTYSVAGWLSVWDSSPEAGAAGTCWSDSSSTGVVKPVACSEASPNGRTAAIRISQDSSGGALMAASMLRLLSSKPYFS